MNISLIIIAQQHYRHYRIPYNSLDFPSRFKVIMCDENVPLDRLEIRSEVGVLQRRARSPLGQLSTSFPFSFYFPQNSFPNSIFSNSQNTVRVLQDDRQGGALCAIIPLSMKKQPSAIPMLQLVFSPWTSMPGDLLWC